MADHHDDHRAHRTVHVSPAVPSRAPARSIQPREDGTTSAVTADRMFAVTALVLLTVLSGCASPSTHGVTSPDSASNQVHALRTGDLRVTAASADTNSGSSPGGAIDGSHSTWWGTNNLGGAIRFDPGEPAMLSAVRIAFLKGTQRTATFDVQVTNSPTVTSTTTWTTVMTRTSNGHTSDFQRFQLPAPVSARHFRLVNRGTSAGTATAFTEVVFEGTTSQPTSTQDLRIVATAALDSNNGSSSTPDTSRNVTDQNLSTHWGTNHLNSWIRLDTGAPHTLQGMRIAFYNGTTRKARFSVQVTTETNPANAAWTTVMTRESSGSTNAMQHFALPAPVHARHVRIVNLGTTTGTATAFTEIALEGEAPNSPGTSITWTNGTPAPIKRWESQGLSAEGRLFTFGGFRNTPNIPVYATRESYRYDPASDSWTRIADLPEAVTHAGQAFDDAKRAIYLAGGFVGNGYTTVNPIVTTARVWKYDIPSNTWSAGPSLPAPRAGGALVRRGRFLHFFAGTIRTGDRFQGDFNSHWMLNLDQPSAGWQARAPYPLAVNHLSGVAVGDTIYGLGGQRADAETSSNTAAVYAYDAATDTWSSSGAVASMPRPLGHAGASTFTHRGRIIVVGGVTNDAHSTSGGREVGNVISYDPGTNRWTELTPLPSARQSPVADVVNGAVVVTTGDGADKAPHATTWRSSVLP